MAVNVFMRFSNPAIRGESTDPDHDGEVQLLSWSHSFNQPTRATRADSAAVEQASHSDFTFSKYLDTATDELLGHCWSGKPIGRAEMTCYRADGDNAALLYLTVVMEDVIVSNVSIGGGPGDLPTETISLAYAKVTYIYHDVAGRGDASGSVSHDLTRQVVG